MGLYPLTVNTPPEDPAHIYAEDDAAIYEAIVGGDGVYDIGNKLKAIVIDNNTVRISNGVLSVGGHLARIKFGDYQDMVIDNGESGKNRNDLIVANFSTTGPRGVDTYTLKVIKGEAVSGEAADPVVADGNLYEGATERDLPLYRVRLEGISIVAVDTLHCLKKTIEGLQGEVTKLNSNRTYSANEVRIGTTADGEPVYRKIIKVPMTYFTKKEQYVDLKAGTGTSMKKIISCSVQAHSADGTIYPFPYTEGGTEMSTWLHKFTTVNGGTIFHFYNKAEWGSSYTAYITVEYTKL